MAHERCKDLLGCRRRRRRGGRGRWALAGRCRGLFSRAWHQACSCQDPCVAGWPPGFLPDHVALLLAHGMAPCPLAGRIGCGERLGQMPQRVGLAELRMPVGQRRGAGRPSTRVLGTEPGPHRPLQVPQGREERLARGLVQLRQPTTTQRPPRGQVAHAPNVGLTSLGRETIQGDDQAALLLGDLGQTPVLLTLVAGQQGSISVLREIAHRGCGDGDPAGEIGVHLARGRALGLPQPAKAHEHIIAIRGAGRRQALGRRRAQPQARARTRRVRAAARACGNGEEASARLHGLIPRKGVPRNQEVTAVEVRQQCRVINDALCGVESLWGSPGHLFARVWSTLAECEGGCFAHENPHFLTG